MKWGNEKLDMGLDLRNKKFENISILISNILTHFPRLITSLLFILMLGASLSLAAEPIYPNYIGYVNDFAGVLDSGTKQQINAICVSLEATTKSELAVVTVKTTAPLDSKSYVVKLFEKWKVGKKGLDNGVIFLLASDDRRVEIEVGYGLEGVLNDAKAGEILDQFVIPSLKKGNFSEGLFLGSKALSQRIIEKYGKPLRKDVRESWLTLMIALGIINLLLILSIYAIIYVSIKKQFYYFFIVIFATVGGYFFAGILGAILGFVYALNLLIFHGIRSSGGWSSVGGSSFGGGMSGGGGAGRSF